MSRSKTYLEKKEFLDEDDQNDKTTVTAEVRRYEWGGYTANLEITAPPSFGGNGGIHISCSPDSKESCDNALKKVHYIQACLKEFEASVKEAHKDSANNSKSNKDGSLRSNY